MDLDGPGCIWNFPTVPGCNWLYLTWLYLALPWCVSDHYKMVSKAKTNKGDGIGWMDWKIHSIDVQQTQVLTCNVKTSPVKKA